MQTVKMNSKVHLMLAVLLSLALPFETFGYVPLQLKDHYLSDVLLREIVDRMGNDLADNTDTYIDPLDDVPAHLALMARASKDLETEQMDYDALLDGNPNPSLRDQEYLQHSSLWGHQYVSGGAGEGPHRLKPQIKTDATLPAYCNPPNPCPHGYAEEQGCIVDFENTASFSREYQAAQDCMCDAEHMFHCPDQDQNDDSRQMSSDFESFLARQFHTGEHKNLVAKKFHHRRENTNDSDSSNNIIKNSLNPYLQGEKLPVAAKKGNNVL